MEEGEVFDSSLLKDYVHSLIANGKRNFAIDLTALDYLYSDTINVLMALNKRALEVSGRLSLLGPQPEVLQILKRAGIHNILRIFDTETDLIKTSEEIILQTTSYKVGDIKNIRDNVPQSEFDQLRDEIGSVFGSSDEANSDQQFVQNPPQQGYRTDPSIDQEFDEAFQHFESDEDFQDDQANQFDQGQYPNQYTSPIPQNRRPSSPGQFGNRQFTPQPPPPVPPKMPTRQPYPSDSRQQPEFQSNRSGASVPPPPDIMMRQETQRFPSAPAAPQKPSVAPLKKPSKDSFDETFEMASPKAQTTKMDSFDDDDDFDFEENKKSAVPVLILVFVVVLLGGAGIYFGISRFSKGTDTTQTVATVTDKNIKPDLPQIPVDSTDSLKSSQDEAQKDSENETPKPVVKKVETKKSSSRSTPRSTVRSTPRPKPKPAPRPRPAPSTDKNEVVFTSQPSGAAVVLNGKTLGTTPFTWDKPFFGEVSVIVNKTGYKQKNVSFEFTGGKQKQSVSLEREPAPKPVARVEKPKPTPPPPPPKPAPKKPEVNLPDPEPSAPAAASVSGANASIFIASIPPVADVYLNGKLIGKTNVNELKLPAGTHSLKFVKGAKELVKAITVKPGGNPSQMVRLP